MSTIANVIVPDRTATPRGAKLVGWLVDAGAALRAYLKAYRAERDAMRRCRDANAVRSYAQSLQNSEPGLASDLFAAADRHSC